MDAFSVQALLAACGARSFEHEQVVLFQDPACGLRAVVAIHSTALGPAVGGTRFRAYPDDKEAVSDVLRLSRGMSYKNAMAGLDHGGGKAVIIGDPEHIKCEGLLLAYARCVESLGGRYLTGCDVGTCTADMDVIARACRWTLCRSSGSGGRGDTAAPTALGVLQGLRAAARHRWGTPSLEGRRVGVEGVGKVGRRLVGHLLAEGAQVVVADVDGEAVRRVVEQHPRVTAVEDAWALTRTGSVDVYAPCALGGTLNDARIPSLDVEVVCGAANNQLDHPGAERQLADRGILYVPDYVVNAGGAIQAAGEFRGMTDGRIAAEVERIHSTTLAVLDRARAEGVLPGVAADRIAEQRIAAAVRTRERERG